MLIHQGRLEFLGQPKSITTIYQRLINDDTEAWKTKAQLLFDQIETRTEHSDPARSALETSAPHPESSSYDPELKPESTTIYPSRGLRIESIEITDVNNKRRNIIPQGENFAWS